MHFSILIASACVATIAVLASPISTVSLEEVGCVTVDGKNYELSITGVPNIRVITDDRKDGYYIRPDSYHVTAGHVCKFYSEATRGVGSLIGEFKGPVDASFGADWAAFYECCNPALAPVVARDASIAECGFVVAPSGLQMPLDLRGKTRFDVDEQLIIPVYYMVAEHCQCDFFVQDTRGGHSPPVPITGRQGGEFGIYRPWAYNCHHTQ